MKPKPIYLLIWKCGNYSQTIQEGSKPLLIYKRSQLKKLSQYSKGTLLIVSENGYKYNYQNKHHEK